MKKYLSLIAVLVLLVACMIPAAFADDQITLTVGDVVVDPADAKDGVIKVKVPVYTNDVGVTAGEFGLVTVTGDAKISKVAGRVDMDEDNEIVLFVDTMYNADSTTGVNGFFIKKAENEEEGKLDVKGNVFIITVEIPADKIATYEVSIGEGKGTSVETGLKDVKLVFETGTISFAHECKPGEPVKENEKAATCTEKGSYDMVVYCTECKKELSRETVEVAALGHTPAEAVQENVKDATCTVAGSYEEVVYCSVCKAELSRKTVTGVTLPHTEEVIPAVAATCTADGLTEGKKCSVCGEILVAQEVVKALGHDVVKGAVPAYDCEAGYKTTNTCSRCDWTEEVTVEGHAHAWGAATVIKAATIEETGLVEYKCKHTDHGCEASYTEETPKLNPEEPDPTGDITPYIAMGVLTMVALISSAAYMLLKRKAI